MPLFVQCFYHNYCHLPVATDWLSYRLIVILLLLSLIQRSKHLF